MFSLPSRWSPVCLALLAWLLQILVLPAPAASARGDIEPRLAPSGAVFVPSASVLTYVEQPAVRHDLKLSNEQQARIAELRTVLQAANVAARAENTWSDVSEAVERSDYALVLLVEILTLEQVRRHNQIVMQHLVSRFGLVQLVQTPDVTALLEFDAEQQQSLQTILKTVGFETAPARRPNRDFRPGLPLPPGVPNQPARGRMPNPPRPRRAANPAARRPFSILDSFFTNPDLGVVHARLDPVVYETANDQISALLTTAQKLRLLETLGAPLAARPSGSPPAILCQGTQLFAFPRILTRDGWNRTFQIGQRAIVDGPVMRALLAEEAVREELKLALEQFERLPPLTGNPEDLPGIREELGRSLQQSQFVRLRQLALQTASRCCGKAALLEFKEVANALSLSDEQRAALSDLLRSERQSTRQAVLSAVERAPERRHELDAMHEFDATAGQRLDAILLPPQRRQLSELLGKPFRGKLPAVAIGREIVPRLSIRGRVAPSLGYLTSVPPRFQSDWLMEHTLQLSQEQATAIREFAIPGLNQDENGLIKILTPEQLRQYTEMVLQGSLRSDGPAVVFRYRHVIDALSLSAEQGRRLLEILWDDTRRYLDVPLPELAEILPELDQQTTATIDSILTDEQCQALARLLGEPADDRFTRNLTGRRIGNPPPPGKPPANNRRLFYPVRHGSARHLANIIQQQFQGDAGVQTVAAPDSNGLLIAAPAEILDKIVAMLPQLDRPRQTVIVDVLIVEVSVLREGDLAGEAGKPLLDAPLLNDSELAGPIEQVTARLVALAKQKKIARLQTFRLETLEDQAGMVQVPEEAWLITGTNDFMQVGFSSPLLRSHSVGMIVQVTPRLTGTREVALDLVLRHARQHTPDDSDELGIGPDGPLISQEVITERLITTITVPAGRHVIADRIQTDAKSFPTQLRVIVGARVAGKFP